MKTAFANIALDRVRYSMVWESNDVLQQALDVQPDDEVVLITSAGTNILNMLLQKPKRITAVDINPVQNRLLRLQLHILQNHSYEVFAGVLGLRGVEAVSSAFREVSLGLNETDRSYWRAWLTQHPSGLLTCGQLEEYLNSFVPNASEEHRTAFKALALSNSVAEQTRIFEEDLHGACFSKYFVEYFNNRNLSKGRDAELFKYVKKSGGEVFYDRLRQAVAKYNMRYNFPFQFLFFGLEHLTEDMLPPCYREENYAAMAEAVPILDIVDDEIIEYLTSPQGISATKAGLSNIFEYTSLDDFAIAMEELSERQGKPLRIAFWNLLNAQGNHELFAKWRKAELSDRLTEEEPCFYFDNVQAFDFSA